jgi:hypothetical protein
MRLQPPFFSTGEPHLGQSLVFADMYLNVSPSPSHFSIHSFTILHGTGL